MEKPGARLGSCPAGAAAAPALARSSELALRFHEEMKRNMRLRPKRNETKRNGNAAPGAWRKTKRNETKWDHKLLADALGHTVLEVYNQQRSVLGFWDERSGLGVVWAVPMNFPPSKVPDTTLVPCQMTRMVAGN